ncbi:Torsin-1A-interacting protein 1 [Stylophora pistillata]|uniref:Torsin-1A-interacting protein 1 n=1 Tax=Stylophora pistillata TaxID=50429 RepID=A0A2B4SCF5_STYPI|nr:Torsin-1A-interacting protein 1 [Stylophora pistillata]
MNKVGDESCDERGKPSAQRIRINHWILDPGTKSQSSHFRALEIFLSVAVACIAVFIYLDPPVYEMKCDFDLVEVFENGVEKLQLSFTNQTDRFWKILRTRGLAHLREKYPRRPLVFLLPAPPAAHEWLDCLAIKLTEKLDPRHKTTLAIIDSEKEKANPSETTKKKMDNFLKQKVVAGHRVILIRHLELLPPPSPILFHSYCDDQDAPHKHVAFIFTVHMPVEPSSSLSSEEAEKSVEDYLSGEVWVKVDKNAVASLLSRIADTVVLMNGESSGSVKALCS